MPQTIDIVESQNYEIPTDVHSIRVRLFGGSGAGEYVADASTNFAASAGGNGANTTFLGLFAGGGTGGGQGGKNQGGQGGSGGQTYNWTNLGASLSISNGSQGQIATGGAGGSVGGLTGVKGGDGTPGGASYTSFVFHVFNNETNQHIVTDTSTDLSVGFENPAAEGYGCDPNFGSKHYNVQFNTPFADNNYTISIYGVCQQAAGGSTSGPFYVSGISGKNANGFRVWFCRAGGNSYIRCFSIAADGIKAGAAGRGGGGSGAIETTLTRQMLLSSSTYAPGTIHQITIGSGGTSANSGSAGNGTRGKAQLYILLVPNITISASPTAIIRGNSSTISWNTTGDANTFSLTPGYPNTSVTGSATVTPVQTTTYTATASGLGGSDTKTITITVYQPPEANISGPESVDYGMQGTLLYNTTYANVSVTATPTYQYDSPVGFVNGDTITLNNGSSTELNDPNAFSSGTFQTNIPYTTKGPRSVTYTITATGSGGQVSKQYTFPINIDETPDNIVIPEVEDAYKSEDPVFSPKDVTSQEIRITDIDIPVEIKSDKPIQVDINQEDNWQNIRQL